MTEDQIKFILQHRTVILASADKTSRPRAIFVEVNKADKEEIVITDNEMKITKENILANNRAFLLAYDSDFSRLINIIGTVRYFSSGPYFELAKNLPENKDYSPKGVLVIQVERAEE